jgi:3-oxoadipate enol-lactonase
MRRIEMPKTNVHGLNMYYEFAGEGEPLVLIAGLATDHLGWMETQVPAFAPAGYRCLVFDNRDVGQTDESPTASYTIRQFADDTAGLMEQLDIGPAHVLGASMGGMIAQEFALNYPERVRSLTLSCTFPVCEAVGTVTLESWKTMRRKGTLEDFGYMFAPWLFTYRFFEAPGALQGFMDMAQANPFPQSVAGFARQCDAVMTQDTLDRLERIAAPTHVIVGDEDILTPPRYSRLLAEKIPGAQLTVIPESGHCLFWEKPMEFDQAVIGFLKEH